MWNKPIICWTFQASLGNCAQYRRVGVREAPVWDPGVHRALQDYQRIRTPPTESTREPRDAGHPVCYRSVRVTTYRKYAWTWGRRPSSLLQVSTVPATEHVHVNLGMQAIQSDIQPQYSTSPQTVHVNLRTAGHPVCYRSVPACVYRILFTGGGGCRLIESATGPGGYHLQKVHMNPGTQAIQSATGQYQNHQQKVQAELLRTQAITVCYWSMQYLVQKHTLHSQGQQAIQVFLQIRDQNHQQNRTSFKPCGNAGLTVCYIVSTVPTN